MPPKSSTVPSPGQSAPSATIASPPIISKRNGPITLVDVLDGIITHYAGIEHAKRVAPPTSSLGSSGSSSSSSAPPAAVTAAEKEQILWAARSYVLSSGALARYTSFIVEGANAGAYDLAPLVKKINSVIQRTSATCPVNGSSAVESVSSVKAGKEKAEKPTATNGTVGVTPAAALPIGSKRAREGDENESKAAALEAETMAAANSPADGTFPVPSQSAAGDASEPSRRYVSNIPTFFDFSGYMAWRARNTLHSHSLLSLALSSSDAPTESSPTSNGGAKASTEQSTATTGTGMPPPSAFPTTARSLTSPTSNLLSNHADPSTAAFFEHCRAIFPSSAIQPFAHDGDFVATLELVHLNTYWCLTYNNLGAPATMKSDVLHIVEKYGISLRHLTIAANACFLAVQFFASARLAVSVEKPPRVVRLCASFNLSKAESCAMSYVLAIHGGTQIATTFTQPLAFVNVGRICSLDPRGLAVFLQSDRLHIRQGVLHPIDQMMAKITFDMRVLMPLEVVTSLCGANIPEEEFVKLEDTCLWNLIQAERNNNYGVIATKGSKPASAAAAYLASNKNTDGKKKARKAITFGNNKLMSALGDLLNADANNDTNSSACSSDGESDAGNASSVPCSPTGLVAASDNGDVETIDNDDATSSRAGGASGHGPDSLSSASNDTPYTNDIEYLDDSFRILAMMIKSRNSEGDMKDEDDIYFSTPKTKVEAQLREFAGRQRVLQKRVEMRMNATKVSGSWVPRIEKVSERLRLTPFEKQLLMLLVGNVVSHDVLVAINGRSVMRDGARELTVGYILFVLCASLPERVACRHCFFDSSPLIANGLISLSVGTSTRTKFNTDLMEYLVDIDRSIVDYLMGTEVDPDEMVQGSRLYTPDVPLSHVALPNSIKDKVLSTIEHYSLFAKCKEKCGFGKGLGTGGSGLVFLFHGPSGTGKTMLANAVAHDLKKKILLVNLLQYRGEAKAPEILRYVFREAKLNDAIIFFDECESFFEQRENNSVVTAVLAEFEKYSGMIILATNRAQIIDEAMNRRISLMIEFKLPDHQMREQIWRTHLPTNLSVAPNVSVQQLAMDYELSGGLIRNAVLAAMSSAVGREQSETPTLTMADLQLGAKQQLRGFFQANEAASQEYITPQRSLDELVVDSITKESITAIAKSVKARGTLFAQWGFNEKEYDDQGEICLFHGPSGTGKSLAAEGIAYECSSTIRLCNVAEMFVNNSFNIQAVFDEARKLGAIVVFDQAQNLFDYSEMAGKISQLIQYHAVRYPRPVIVIATTSATGVSSIDTRASRILFNSEISFQLPTKQLRRELWRRSFPAQVPMADDIDFERLAAEQLSAKAIRSISFAACCKAALLPLGKQLVSKALVLETQEEYQSRERKRNTHSSMFT